VDKKQITESVILEAARQVFSEKGLSGARMQEIADRAGINKALLHYYFRSKEKLFERIFVEAFSEFWPGIETEMLGGAELETVLKLFINTYIDLLIEKPFLPIFILNELHHNPDRVEQLLRDSGMQPQKVVGFLDDELSNLGVKHITARELLVNILSLCVFPFLGKPIINRMFWENSEVAYQLFLEDRKQSVYRFIMNALKNEQ
jgi:AcrR family transcriptional regulator